MTGLIIDTSYLIYRSYFAYPDLTHQGNHIGAVFGFCKTVVATIQKYDPDYLIFARDLPTPTWRHKVYQEYKAGRAETEQRMIDQIPIITDWCNQISKNVLAIDGYEADDLIFSSAIKLTSNYTIKEAAGGDELFVDGGKDIDLDDIKQAKKTGNKVYIFSSDKDLYQLLVLPGVNFLKSKKGGDIELYGIDQFTTETALDPTQWVDYKALVGDGSDNLKGVEGVGPKTAIKILHEIGSLFYLFENLGLNNSTFTRTKNHQSDEAKAKLEAYVSDQKNSKIIEKIRNSQTQLISTYALACLHFLPDTKLETGIDLMAGIEVFEKYNFKSLITTLNKMGLDKDQDGLF
ncbi:MAG: 5'-3' exonuclease H3TH domain-containing protein [bacterium]